MKTFLTKDLLTLIASACAIILFSFSLLVLLKRIPMKKIKLNVTTCP